MAFLEFDDLLDHLENLICFVIDRSLADPKTAELVKQLNPNFVKPSRPFMRMKYKDAITY